MAISVPSFPKNRGTFDQDPVTGSTRQHVVNDSRNQGYTDASGQCGCDLYSSIGASLSIYDNINCTRRLVGAVSISVQIREDEYNLASFATLVDAAQTYIASKLIPFNPAL